MKTRLPVPVAVSVFVALTAVGWAGCTRGGAPGVTPTSGQSGGGFSGGGGTVRPDGGESTSGGGCVRAAQVLDSVPSPTLRTTLPGSWDENWFASPTLVDLDGDENLDIVAARHSVLYAWRHDGTPLWKTAFGYSAGASPEHGDRRMYPSAAAGDFDGDGDVEIAVASDRGAAPAANVAVYDHRGILLPGWPVRFGDAEVRSLAVADVTGDGRGEVLVNKTGEGPSTAVLSLDGSVMPGWPQVSASCHPASPAPPCFDYGGYHQNIGAADLDGDGVIDVVSSYDYMGFGIFRGSGAPFAAAASFADEVVTGVEAYHDLRLAEQGWGVGDRSEFTDSPPVIGDVDGDGHGEIVLVGNHEHSEDYSSRGYSLWVFNPDATRPPGWEWPKDTGAPLRTEDPGNNVVLTLPSPALGNLDGKPGPEIVFPGYDGRLYAYAGDGAELWSFSFATTSQPYLGASEPLLVDLDGDARSEVIFTTWSSGAPNEPETMPELIVLAPDGTLLHRVALSGRGSMAAPSVGDLDRDGQLELVISLKDAVGGQLGGVQIWDLPGARARCAPWPTGRGNMLRTGVSALATGS